MEAGKPLILSIENSVTMDIVFPRRGDDYMNIWIRTDEGRELSVDNVYGQVGPFAMRPVMVQRASPVQWQVCSKVPLGLTPGWYDVTLRVDDSAWSNPLQIGVELTEAERPKASSTFESEDLRIGEATDGKTWEPFAVRLGPDSWISVWVHGLPDAARMEDVRVRLNGFDLQPAFLSPRDAQGRRQVNAKLPSGLKSGQACVAVIFDDHKSRDVEVRLVREVE